MSVVYFSNLHCIYDIVELLCQMTFSDDWLLKMKMSDQTCTILAILLGVLAFVKANCGHKCISSYIDAESPGRIVIFRRRPSVPYEPFNIRVEISSKTRAYSFIFRSHD